MLLLGLCGLIVYYTATIHSSNWLYIVEGLIALCLLFLILFYRRVVRPIRSISQGLSLLKEQDFNSRLRHVGQHEADNIIDVFNPMMEQLKNERLRVREQNHFLDLVTNASPMGIITLNDKGKVVFANPAATRLVGCRKGDEFGKSTSPLARRLMEIPHGKSNVIRLSDAEVFRGSHLSYMDNGYSHPFLLIEILTEEVAKAEKRAYEKVIRMMSHEVNNTVCGVNSTLESVAAIIGDEDDGDEIKSVINACQNRTSDLSRFITNFANVVKIPEPQLEHRNLNEIIADNAIFLETLVSPHGVSLTINLDESPLETKIDESLFQQAIINIVKNSVESIGRNGEITITTNTEEKSLIIADNGAGITPEVAQHIFTPFYSTKRSGQGIGLILISDILRKHGCTFSLATSDSDGLTRFIIHFP